MYFPNHAKAFLPTWIISSLAQMTFAASCVVFIRAFRAFNIRAILVTRRGRAINRVQSGGGKETPPTLCTRFIALQLGLRPTLREHLHSPWGALMWAPALLCSPPKSGGRPKRRPAPDLGGSPFRVGFSSIWWLVNMCFYSPPTFCVRAGPTIASSQLM